MEPGVGAKVPGRHGMQLEGLCAPMSMLSIVTVISLYTSLEANPNFVESAGKVASGFEKLPSKSIKIGA